MKGLLKRDLYLTKKSAPWVLLLLIFVFVKLYNKTSYDSDIMLVCILAGLITFFTAIYDFRDNGLAFLQTLPFTPKEYVVSRYIVLYLGLTVFGVLGIVLNWVLIYLKNWNLDGNITFWSVMNEFTICWGGMLLYCITVFLLFCIFSVDIAGMIIIIFSVSISLIVAVNLRSSLLFRRSSLTANGYSLLTYKEGLIPQWYRSLSDRELSLGRICIVTILYVILMFINIQVMKKKEY